MVQENEVVMLLLGVGVLVFILANRKRLADLPSVEILLVGYYLLLAGWLLTVLEGFFWGEVLNIVEHGLYAASAILVAAWCWRMFGQKGVGR